MVEAMMKLRIKTKQTIVAGVHIEQRQDGPHPGMKDSENSVHGNSLGTELTNDIT